MNSLPASNLALDDPCLALQAWNTIVRASQRGSHDQLARGFDPMRDNSVSLRDN